ncbi:MAG: sigma-70 family RNA polymerase sigma factor [Thermoanaerobaculia bacterium]
MATIERHDAVSAPSDEELIGRTISGETDAFEVLVERYQKKIYRVAYSIVRSEADADGVTQDTFVRAFTKLARFENRSGFETWLTRIAINRSRDVLRGRRWVSLDSMEGDRGSAAAFELADSGADSERALFSRQIEKAIERAAATLSARQRTIFRLRHFEELPLEEIARMMGLRAGTVRSHLFRAVQKLRRELEEWMRPAATKGRA